MVSSIQAEFQRQKKNGAEKRKPDFIFQISHSFNEEEGGKT